MHSRDGRIRRVREEFVAGRPRTFRFSGFDPRLQLLGDPRVELVLAAVNLEQIAGEFIERLVLFADK